jgi:thioredoxin-disulfide reductase
MFDLIIIGAGPAGMTAAIYAVREKLNSLLLTREFGGQMAKKEVEIENYPGLGKIAAHDLIGRFSDHVKSLNTPVEMDEVKKISKKGDNFLVEGQKKTHQSKAVLVATGADPRFLNVPGESEFVGKGVGYCATCDGPLFSGRAVAVVGGGNSAFESALFLAKFAKKIYLIEGGERPRASADIQDKVKATGKAEVVVNAKVLAIKGDQFVSGLSYQDVKTGVNAVIPLEGVFVKIGSRPASGIVGDLADLNETGEIVYDERTHQTKTPGLFAAGDVSQVKYKQIVIACGEGAKAVLSVSEYFRNNG